MTFRFDKSTHFFDKSISSIIEFENSDLSFWVRGVFKYQKRLMIIQIRNALQEIGLYFSAYLFDFKPICIKKIKIYSLGQAKSEFLPNCL